MSDQRKADQKAVDSVVLEAIRKHPEKNIFLVIWALGLLWVKISSLIRCCSNLIFFV